MADDRRRRRGRAVERARENRQTRAIYLGAGAVLAVAAISVLVGLFLTWYQPSRAHVLTVEGERYDARDVVSIGVHLVYSDGSVAYDDLARGTLDALIEQTVIRAAGPRLVDAVTRDDIDRELRLELGLDSPEPAGLDSAATEAAATAGADEANGIEEELAEALRAHLQEIGLDRPSFEAIMEARLYRERLTSYFAAQVGDSGPQVRLRRIRVTTQVAVDDVQAELAREVPFDALAEERSVAQEDGPGGEIGWTATELLADDVRAVVESLVAGEHSPAIATGLFFEIYLVAEIDNDHEYAAATASRLRDARFEEWLAAEVTASEPERGLSTDEESWINRQALSELERRAGG